jgi:hypothetical protein
MKNQLIIGSVILIFSCSAWSSNLSNLGHPIVFSEFKLSAGLGTWAVGKAAKAVAKKTGKSAKKPPSETGGPVVKTGPTRGENRSRNNDGTWRKKRSDAEE